MADTGHRTFRMPSSVKADNRAIMAILLTGSNVSVADLVERQLWRSQNTTEADAVNPAVLLKA